MISNRKMQKLLKKVVTLSEIESLDINLESVGNVFSPSFVQVEDCIIISDERSENELRVGLEYMIKEKMGRTGFEAINTEMCINYVLPNSSLEVVTLVALFCLKVWAHKLKKIDEKSTFCMIISCADEGDVTIRFHKVRDCEPNWLSENINKYKEAVGYFYV